MSCYLEDQNCGKQPPCFSTFGESTGVFFSINNTVGEVIMK